MLSHFPEKYKLLQCVTTITHGFFSRTKLSGVSNPVMSWPLTQSPAKQLQYLMQSCESYEPESTSAIMSNCVICFQSPQRLDDATLP